MKDLLKLRISKKNGVILGFNVNDLRSNKTSRVQDSLIKGLVKLIKKEYLLVDKPSRKTTILEIGFDHKDEVLAKIFNENLVQNC